MLINVVHSGGGDAFDAVVYGEQHPANVNYFQNQVASVSTSLTDFGRSFFADSQAVFDKYHGAEALRLAEAAMRAAKGLFIPNRIAFLSDIGQLQQAPMVMQRWNMANPMVRQRFHEQRLDGYADTYVDMYPGQIGEQHYDWRRVMNNTIQEDAEGWKVVTYMEDLQEGDKELTNSQKADIFSTWDILEMFLEANKDDPTSPYNTKL